MLRVPSTLIACAILLMLLGGWAGLILGFVFVIIVCKDALFGPT